MQTQKIIAISDIHILDHLDPIYRDVLNLISKEVDGQTQLILAGDIFDFLVGNQKIFKQRYHEFFDLLDVKGRAGAEIHYVEGNHDFHLKRALEKITGVHVHSSEVSLDLGEKKLFIAHGDLIDREDYGYLALRVFFRSSFIRFASKVVPEKVIEKIGTTSSDLSQKKNPRQMGQMSEDRIERTRKIFRNFAADKITQGYDFVILGHCHDADEIQLSIGDRRGQYLNVGYPKAHRTFIRWASGESFMSRVNF